MPELPEVESFLLNIIPLLNSKVVEVITPSPTLPKQFPTTEFLQTSLINKTIISAERKGKLIKLTTSNNLHIFLHMMMTGRISSPTNIPKLESLNDTTTYPPPHTHLIVKAANGAEFSFSDSRRFGFCKIFPSSDNSLFDELAIDGLDSNLASDDNVAKLANQTKGVKALLLDQKKIVSGVGNWVADEICYNLNMHPDEYPPPHTHLIVKAANGAEFSFSDSRRFGFCKIFPSSDNSLFDELAIDGLDSNLASDDNVAKLANQTKGVKALLLDQKKIVSGVGNWVADEICYNLNMHPDENNLTLAAAKQVLETSHHVLSTAVKSSSYPQEWLFHFRWEKKSPVDFDEKPISFILSGGRTTAIVKSRQQKGSFTSSKTKFKTKTKIKVKPSTNKRKNQKRADHQKVK